MAKERPTEASPRLVALPDPLPLSLLALLPETEGEDAELEVLLLLLPELLDTSALLLPSDGSLFSCDSLLWPSCPPRLWLLTSSWFVDDAFRLRRALASPPLPPTSSLGVLWEELLRCVVICAVFTTTANGGSVALALAASEVGDTCDSLKWCHNERQITSPHNVKETLDAGDARSKSEIDDDDDDAVVETVAAGLTGTISSRGRFRCCIGEKATRNKLQ